MIQGYVINRFMISQFGIGIILMLLGINKINVDKPLGCKYCTLPEMVCLSMASINSN